jgi:hypothetical protein
VQYILRVTSWQNPHSCHWSIDLLERELICISKKFISIPMKCAESRKTDFWLLYTVNSFATKYFTFPVFYLFSLPRPDPLCAPPPQPPIQWELGAVSPGKKRPVLEASSNAEAKNVWNYTSTPPYVFVACYLVKQRNNFTFLPISHVGSWKTRTHFCHWFLS